MSIETEETESTHKFKKGDRLRHPKFGRAECVGRIEPSRYAKIPDDCIYIKPDVPLAPSKEAPNGYADILMVDETNCVPDHNGLHN